MAQTQCVSRNFIKKLILFVCFLTFVACLPAAQSFPDRFVWVFGWNLGKDSDVPEIARLIESAGKHGINGAVLSAGLDTLCQENPAYFRRLEAIKALCESNHLELIPALFSIGYGSGILAHDRNLAEGLPVEDAPFLVEKDEAQLTPGDSVRLANGGFEQHTGDKMKGFEFCDQPGEISFADTEVKHGGQVSLRLENFTANQYGHGRVMQTLAVQPHRCYRLTLWVKTEGLQPAGALKMLVMAGNRELAPREFKVPSTTDWRKLSILFNSLGAGKVRLYAGLWGGKSGKVWLDDWSVEEVGPINVLRRPGTPVTVRNEDGTLTYVEDKDYGPLKNDQLHPWREDGEPARLKILPGSRIHNGERLRVSWYHSAVIHDGQVTVCMAEPAVYEIFDHEAKLLAEHLHPRRLLLNMDEIRMGGTCRACQGRNLGELLGECITKQTQILRRHIPNAQVYIWSDMLDPNHNAHGDYYLAQGDFSGSWRHVPQDLVMAVWGGEPREKSLRFFADEGFQTLVACYYDGDDLTTVKGWLELARKTPRVQGLMYTPWQKKYDLLPAFGDLLKE